MSISPIGKISEIYKQSAQAIKGTSDTGVSSGAFKAIFDAAKNVIGDTTQLQSAADATTNDFITGKIDNIHQVLIANEKASVALQFTVELRNKAIEAYKEIMRLQM
ncbi:MAG TPA: flagellar hook-basal body complex protein FliE [Clostridiales bacterium]|nr:MAG: flagellar hook-basal body complex protein FliE [Clostridiales bacterium GWD2_32_59]HAN09872.1 flagellar hook-basal body complex protein FliE [Clostridiales bacterium]